MKFRLVWACGGVVVLVVVIVLAVAGNAARNNDRPSAAIPTARPTPGPVHGPPSASLLEDDTLPLPKEEASLQERVDYLQAIERIRSGHDPLAQQRPILNEAQTRVQERLRIRREYADRRSKEAREKLFATPHPEELKARLRAQGIDVTNPPPPLFPRPELGPAVVEVDPVTGETKPAPEPDSDRQPKK